MCMKFNKKIYKNIEGCINQSSINQRELAKLMGIAESTLSGKLSRLNNGKGITTTTLVEIAKALKVSPIELLK
ncbi:MAG: helix-turn-helix domain-containing protein [Cetobacterium sp.]